MSAKLAQSPLHGMADIIRDNVTITELPLITKITVRGRVGGTVGGNADNATLQQAVKDVTGCDLCQEFNRFTVGGNRSCQRIGPDEWLLYCGNDDASATIAKLRKATDGIHAAFVDVSDYYTTLRIAGAGALDLLAKGTPLDLRQQSTDTGFCGGTHFLHAAILIMVREFGQTYDIQVRWSFAEYLYGHFSI